MKKALINLLCLMLLIGCSNKSDNQLDTAEETTNKEETIEEKEDIIETKELKTFYNSDNYETRNEAVARYNKFAIELCKKAYKENKNELLSPFSLYNALAVLANGASGDSKTLLENLLGMTVYDLNAFLSDSSYYADFYSLANSIWINTKLVPSVSKQYESTVNFYYGSAINKADFSLDPKQVVQQINNWADKETNGSIKNVMNEEDVKDDTAFYIVNALAAGDYWLGRFKKDLTFYSNYANYDGTSGTVEMMHQTLDGYWHDDKSYAFRKELENGLEFVAILPNDGVDVYDYLESMDENTISNLMNSYISRVTNKTEGPFYDEYGNEYHRLYLDFHYTDLSLPKFEYKSDNDLNDTLKKMGIGDLFDPNTADFSAMSNETNPELYIKNVKQLDNILVNEERVEASAVTVIEGGRGAAGPLDEIIVEGITYHQVNFNKPFIYVIKDYNGKILFMGIASNFELNNSLIPIEILTDKVRVRSSYSSSSDLYITNFYPKEHVLGAYKGDKLFAYEKVQNEGYTWYRIGEKAWIADEKGEWIKEN